MSHREGQRTCPGHTGVVINVPVDIDAPVAVRPQTHCCPFFLACGVVLETLLHKTESVVTHTTSCSSHTHIMLPSYCWRPRRRCSQDHHNHGIPPRTTVNRAVARIHCKGKVPIGSRATLNSLMSEPFSKNKPKPLSH